MSEIAEDMVSGFCCSWCGIYFVEAHGFPVVCKECADGASKSDLACRDVQLATKREV
jgi:hypothetical protein